MSDNPETHEPMLNIPPVILTCAAVLSVCFAYFTLQPEKSDSIVDMLAFVPTDFSDSTLQHFYTLFSYALLHFGWAHFGTNIAGLLAFGSGVVRYIGKLYFLLILIGGIFFGALGHWVLFPDSLVPLGGVSGGISALFGAVLPLIVTRKSLIAGNLVFILTNIAIGMMGIPGEPGLSIAWQAHICGFLFGEIFVLWISKKQRPANHDLQDAD